VVFNLRFKYLEKKAYIEKYIKRKVVSKSCIQKNK